MKILLAGGSGFLGQAIINNWPVPAEFKILSTNLDLVDNETTFYWDGHHQGHWIHLLKKTDVLINLAGRSVNCRYTKKNKNEILQSRINSTNVLGQVVNQLDTPPPIWINASTATIYRDEWDNPNTEESGILGNNFSEKVAKEWERAFFAYNTAKIRQVALRASLVLGSDGDLFNI